MYKRQVARYQKEVAPTIEEDDRFQPMGEDGPYSVLQRMDHYDPFFGALKSDTRFRALAELLMGSKVYANHIQFFNVIPDYSPPTPPHQDALNLRCLNGRVLNIWLPLSKVDAENGCLHYVPSSHKCGPRFHTTPNQRGPDIIDPYRPLDVLSEVAIHTELGDVVIHHGYTVHGSETNFSKKQRWALGFPFVGNFIPVSKETWLKKSTKMQTSFQ